MTNLTTTKLTTALDARTLRALRRRIERPGYSRKQADYGIAWACEQGFASNDEGFALAMSRILYSDEALEEGARFAF